MSARTKAKMQEGNSFPLAILLEESASDIRSDDIRKASTHIEPVKIVNNGSHMIGCIGDDYAALKESEVPNFDHEDLLPIGFSLGLNSIALKHEVRSFRRSVYGSRAGHKNHGYHG